MWTSKSEKGKNGINQVFRAQFQVKKAGKVGNTE